MAGELWLDEYGEDRVREWYLHTDAPAEHRAFVRSVLEGVAARRPYSELGVVLRDVSGGQVAISDPSDPTITLVIRPYADDAGTFSVVFVGNLEHL